jgi:hypothetical protein
MTGSTPGPARAVPDTGPDGTHIPADPAGGASGIRADEGPGASAEPTGDGRTGVQEGSPGTGTNRALGPGLVALAALAVGGVLAVRRNRRPESSLATDPAGRAARGTGIPAPLGSPSRSTAGVAPLVAVAGPAPERRSPSATSAPRPTPSAPVRRPDPVSDWAFRQASDQLAVNPVLRWG